MEWQVRVAEGQPLPLRQKEVTTSGHAIEVRLYAENPASDFLPVTGTIALWRPPQGEGVRVESGIESGNEVSIYYDPMLAKIIACGPDRATATRRLSRALEQTRLLGLTSNRAFLRDLLASPAFQAGELSTNFLAEHFTNWQEPEGDLALALSAVTLAQWSRQPQLVSNAGYWRNNRNQPQSYRYALPAHEKIVEVALSPERRPNLYLLTLELEPEQTLHASLDEIGEHELVLTLDGYRQRVAYAIAGERWEVQTRRGEVYLQALPLLPLPRAEADAGGSLRAPMPGSILAVLVEPGQRVAKGDPLLKLEAMKMEHTIRTAADAIVEEVYYAAGDTVAADTLLVKLREV